MSSLYIMISVLKHIKISPLKKVKESPPKFFLISYLFLYCSKVTFIPNNNFIHLSASIATKVGVAGLLGQLWAQWLKF